MLDATAGRVLRTVHTGTMGEYTGAPVAVDERTGRVFVLNDGDTSASLPLPGTPLGRGTVSVLDAATGAVLRTTRVGYTPSAVVVDARAGRVFVLNSYVDIGGYPLGPGSVSVLDATSGRVLRTVPAGRGPQVAAVDEQDGRVFVANRYRGITVLNASAGTAVSTIDVAVPCALAVDQRAGLLIVQAEVVGPGDYGSYGRALVVDERSGKTLHAINLDGNCTQGGETVDQADGHAALFETPTSGTNNPGAITVLDPHDGQIVQDTQVTDHFGFGAWAVDERLHRAFAAYENHISVVDTRSGAVLRTVDVAPESVAPQLTGIAVAQSTGRIFVVQPAGNVVRMLDARTLAVLPLAGAGHTL